MKIPISKLANTIVASNPHYHPRQMRRLNYEEEKMIGTFPQDYDFMHIMPRYLIGMSVPPVMMAQVAHQVYEQLIEVTQ